MELQGKVCLITGGTSGIGYAFIIAMAATSFDRSAAAIGPRAWRILQYFGATAVIAVSV